jgi:predicted RNase H-like nuclease (RuvC/YqgF family)
MGSLLMELTSPEGIVAIGPVILLFMYIAYKEWPELKSRISEEPLKEKQMQEADENLATEIHTLEQKIQKVDEELGDEINQVKGDVRELSSKILGVENKLTNDYARINRLEIENDQIRKMAESSLDERRILMECNLALLKAVRELGANGPTGVKEAEEKLQEYLNRKAHIIGL